MKKNLARLTLLATGTMLCFRQGSPSAVTAARINSDHRDVKGLLPVSALVFIALFLFGLVVSQTALSAEKASSTDTGKPSTNATLSTPSPPKPSSYRNYLQTTASTCGPAALRFLLAHFGIAVEEDRLAETAGTKKDVGTTLLGLAKTAEFFGMKTSGQLWNWARLRQENNPALLYINDNHYVVTLESNEDSLRYFDPSLGEISKSKDEFLNIWKGIVLAVVPGTEGDRPSAPGKRPTTTGKPGLEISLRQAVERALANGTTMRLATEQLNFNQAQYDLTTANYSPKTELVMSSNKTFNDYGASSIGNSSRTLTNTYQSKYQWKLDRPVSSVMGGKLVTAFGIGATATDHSGDPGNEYAFGPSIAVDYLQPLSKDGRQATYGPIKKARASLDETQYLYELKLQDLIFEVSGSYYDLVRAGRFVELNEENVRQTEKQLETARVQFRLGNLAEIEVLKSEVQMSRDQSALFEARKNYKTSEHRLANLLGLAGAKELSPSGEIEYSPRDIQRDAMIDIALKNRRELLRLNRMNEVLDIDYSAAKSSDDPFLSFNANYQRNIEGRSIDSGSGSLAKKSWNIGMAFTLPLDDYGTTQSKVRSVLAQISELDALIEEMKNRVTYEVDEAIRNLELSKVRYEIFGKSMTVAQENLGIDQLRFGRGVISSDELQRTQLQLLQVKIDRFNALIDFKLSEIALSKATGAIEMGAL